LYTDLHEVKGGCDRRVGAYGHRGGGGRALGPLGGLGLLVRLGTTSLDACGGFSDASSTAVGGEDVLDSRGRDEGPAPGDDKPSSSSCRRILLGRTILFLIESSLVLASAPGLPFEVDCAALLSIG
jgi:hypothetical protein